MCHRYRAQLRESQLAELVRIQFSNLDAFPDGDLYPTYDVPVIRPTDEGNELVAVSWGLLPSWWQPGKGARSTFQRKTFNARSETVHEKPTFRRAFKSRRCLIPASEFYEGGQFFSLQDSPVMTFAGLWESCTIDGEPVESCTIVTTTANALVAQYHPRQRMPVILEGDGVDRWLDPDLVERPALEGLFVPLNPDRMTHRPE